jgi:hypothetical protein
MLIFRRIFLSNYWWQKFDIWSQASYRYPISWEAFFDPSDSYILLAEERGYHRWALAHSSSCLLLVRTLYGMTKFMICYRSVHCMLRSSLWFVTGQNTVRYDQVYDLLLVSTLYVTTILVYDLLLVIRALYVMTKFMICYWPECCMLRPSLWFVIGQKTVCYDQVYDLLLVRTLYVTTKLMICYWSEHYGMTKFMIWHWSVEVSENAMYNDQVWVLLLVRMPYVTTKPTIYCWSVHCMLR